MALGKRTRSRRPTTARRTKRRFNIPRAPRRYAAPTVRVARTFWLENWTPSTVSTSSFWRYYTFANTSMPSWSEFSAVFDQYKINALKYTFRPRYDGFNGENTTDTTLPGITNQGGTQAHVILDPDSDVVPSGTYSSSTLNSFLENGKVRTYRGNKAFSIYWKPKIYNSVSSGLAVQTMRAPYMLTSSNVPHRGYHIFLQDINLTGTFGQSFDVFVTAYMSFRSTK